MAHEAHAVDLCIMASEHIGWLHRRQGRGVLKGHVRMELNRENPIRHESGELVGTK